MNAVYLSGGGLVLALALFGSVIEHWPARSTLLAACSGAAFALAGFLSHPKSLAIIGSLLFVLWAVTHVPERLRRS